MPFQPTPSPESVRSFRGVEHRIEFVGDGSTALSSSTIPRRRMSIPQSRPSIRSIATSSHSGREGQRGVLSAACRGNDGKRQACAPDRRGCQTRSPPQSAMSFPKTRVTVYGGRRPNRRWPSDKPATLCCCHRPAPVLTCSKTTNTADVCSRKRFRSLPNPK